MPASRAGRALLVVLVSIGVLLAVLLPTEARAAFGRTVVLVVGIAIAALYLRRSGPVTTSTPERFEAELRRSTESPPVVPGIRAVEMAVRLATANAQDFEVRLKPMLRDLARWRLLGNRGVDLDANPDAARRILGEPLARLIEDAPTPPSFGAPGVPLADIEAGLEQLERI